MSEIARPSGDKTQYAYSSTGQVTETRLVNPVTGTSINRVEYPSSKVRRFIDPVGRVTVYEFDESGRQTKRILNDGTTYAMAYDDAGRLLTVTLPDQSVQTWTYDASGALTAYKSPTGRETKIQRDPVTGATTTVHSDGTKTKRTFDSMGRLISFTDGLGRTTQYKREGLCHVTEVIDPESRSTKNRFDANGFLVARVDAKGQEIAFERDALGRPVLVTTAGRRTLQFTYSGLGLIASITDAAGSKTALEWDALGRLAALVEPNGARTEIVNQRIDGRDVVLQVKDAEGGTISFSYDASGRLVERTDAMDRKRRISLDAQGRPASERDACDNEIRLQYDRLGSIAQLSDTHGATVTMRHNSEGEITAFTGPDGASLGWIRDAMGRVVVQANPDGGLEQSNFDEAGQLISRVDPEGKTRHWEYNLSGTIKRALDAADHPTSYKYDELDRLTERIDALDHKTRQDFGADGELKLGVNANGKETKVRYDERLRPVETTDPLGHTVTRAYDNVGNTTSLTDENKHTWAYTYDLARRVTSETDPNGQIKRFKYNAAGEVIRIVHADGSVWRFDRDCAGRIAARYLYKPDGTLEDVERFTYDAAGNQVTAENAAVAITSTYDVASRLTRQTIFYKASLATRVLAFEYNKMGRRKLMADDRGRLVTYQYDKNSRPTTITITEVNSTATSATNTLTSRDYTFGWDANSNLTQVDYPNRTRTRRVYDRADRLLELVHERVEATGAQTLASWNYQRDPNGNITQIAREDASVWRFTMDDRDQLVRVAIQGDVGGAGRSRAGGQRGGEEDPATLLSEHKEASYGYDPAGNRDEETYGTRSIRSTFSPANELLRRGQSSYSYDVRGYLAQATHAGGRRELFSFDVAGRLARYGETTVARPDRVTELARYAYDPFSRRVVVEDLAGGLVTRSLWDRMSVIEEHQRSTRQPGKGEVLSLYLRDMSGTLLERQLVGGRPGNSTHGNNGVGNGEDPQPPGSPPVNDGPGTSPGNPGARQRSGTVASASSAAATETSADIQWIHGDYLGSTSVVSDGRGNALDKLTHGPWGEELAGNFEAAAFTYAGTRRDSVSGQQYMHHRWYSASVGRFLSRDPIGFAGGDVNLYRYVANNPILAADPNGLFSPLAAAVAVGAIGAGLAAYMAGASPWGATGCALAGGAVGAAAVTWGGAIVAGYILFGQRVGAWLAASNNLLARSLFTAFTGISITSSEALLDAAKSDAPAVAQYIDDIIPPDKLETLGRYSMQGDAGRLTDEQFNEAYQALAAESNMLLSRAWQAN